MWDKLIVKNSLGKVIREERKSEYDFAITESIYLLNIARKIEPIFISKELGISIRNLNKEEIEYIYSKVSDQIRESMELGYDRIVKCEKIYDEKSSEQTNLINFISNGVELNSDQMLSIFDYIYSKQMYLYGKIDKKIKISKKDIFEDIKNYSNKMAKKICSNFIVLEVKNYKLLYLVFNQYYSLNNDIVRANWSIEKFIGNFVKFMNVIFLGNDSHIDDENCNFQIFKFEDYDFNIRSFVAFYDGYYHNLYKDKNISKNLNVINSNYIDSYIKNNKQNFNNLLFIVSRMFIEDDSSHEFNYREYNLNLITILELLLVNSNSDGEIANKLSKNIMICLSINNSNIDFRSEKTILNCIYRYRSCILHGNYPGYINAMSDLEKILEYKPGDYEFSKYNTIDYLISRKLNLYISNVFKIISKNKFIIDIIKN